MEQDQMKMGVISTRGEKKRGRIETDKVDRNHG